ncbi:MAG TPA: hypothetical protein VFY71_04815 [Planctomycetota bacterium]|nr:hypothetical protein [Planctomycetota bacterium]
MVRVDDEDVNRQDEEWWSYRISTGEPLERARPKSGLGATDSLRMTLDAQPVAGTPLTLSVWHEYDWQHNERGQSSRFVLLDEQWKPVWSLSVPKPDDRRPGHPGDEPSIQATVGDRRFALWNMHERVTCEVAPDAHAVGGWAVHEVSREAWTPVVEAPALPLELALRSLPTVPLDAVSPPVGPVHDVLAFDFDGQGHILLARGKQDAPQVDLLRIGLDGEILGQAAFPDPTAGLEGRRAWHALRGDRWLFCFSPFGEDVKSRAWLVESATGAAQELEAFAGPFVDTACATPDGGVVLLGGYHRKSTIDDSLLCLDAEGQRRWEIVQRAYSGKPSELMACQDVAVDARGSILVLDSTRDAVLVFSAAGEYQRTVGLPEAWATQQIYPVALRVLPDGDWLVHDFVAHTWHRMSPEGADRGGFVGRREDGAIEDWQAVHVDAAGTLWGTDRSRIFAFDASGVAYTRLGAPADAEVLNEVANVHVDALGRIAVSDRRTHAVHLFDGDGRRTLVLQPDPGDFEASYFALEPVISDSRGRTAIPVDSFHGRYLTFGADGRRGGIADLGGSFVSFVPGSSDRWAASRLPVSTGRVRRLTGEGRGLVSVDRRPDHSFFPDVKALACVQDGSVWVLSGTDNRVSSADLELDLFSPTGEPLRSLRLSAAPSGYWDRIAVTPRWLLVSSFEDTALLVSLEQGTVARVRCGGVTKQGCGFGFSPDGKELWCVLPDPLELHRFAMPQ